MGSRQPEHGAPRWGALQGEGKPGTAFPGEGKGRQHDVRLDKLGNITEELNNAFGLNLQERDRLAFEQFEVSWLADGELREVALANTLEGFRLEFEKKFKTTILANEEANQDLYQRLLYDEKFSARILDWYLTRMYGLLRDSGETIVATPSTDSTVRLHPPDEGDDVMNAPGGPTLLDELTRFSDTWGDRFPEPAMSLEDAQHRAYEAMLHLPDDDDDIETDGT